MRGKIIAIYSKVILYNNNNDDIIKDDIFSNLQFCHCKLYIQTDQLIISSLLVKHIIMLYRIHYICISTYL